MNPFHPKLRQMVSNAGCLVVFTGAGISAESGIPTYRGADGLWNKYDPAKFADINHFFNEPAYYWNFFKDVRYPVIRGAKPNLAHKALARLEAEGRLASLITQNIDGLHQEAGSRQVLELHGNTRRILCLACHAEYHMDDIFHILPNQLPPACPACGGTLKPDVVFFGESLRTEVLDAAVSNSREADLFLVVGSSLVVQPAASLPVMAKDNGAKVVIVNQDPTPLDRIADLVIHGTASEALGAL